MFWRRGEFTETNEPEDPAALTPWGSWARIFILQNIVGFIGLTLSVIGIYVAVTVPEDRYTVTLLLLVCSNFVMATALIGLAWQRHNFVQRASYVVAREFALLTRKQSVFLAMTERVLERFGTNTDTESDWTDLATCYHDLMLCICDTATHVMAATKGKDSWLCSANIKFLARAKDNPKETVYWVFMRSTSSDDDRDIADAEVTRREFRILENRMYSTIRDTKRPLRVANMEK